MTFRFLNLTIMQMLTPLTEMKKAKNKKFWSWRAGIFDKFCTC